MGKRIARSVSPERDEVNRAAADVGEQSEETPDLLRLGPKISNAAIQQDLELDDEQFVDYKDFGWARWLFHGGNKLVGLSKTDPEITKSACDDVAERFPTLRKFANDAPTRIFIGRRISAAKVQERRKEVRRLRLASPVGSDVEDDAGDSENEESETDGESEGEVTYPIPRPNPPTAELCQKKLKLNNRRYRNFTIRAWERFVFHGGRMEVGLRNADPEILENTFADLTEEFPTLGDTDDDWPARHVIVRKIKSLRRTRRRQNAARVDSGNEPEADDAAESPQAPMPTVPANSQDTLLPSDEEDFIPTLKKRKRCSVKRAPPSEDEDDLPAIKKQKTYGGTRTPTSHQADAVGGAGGSGSSKVLKKVKKL